MFAGACRGGQKWPALIKSLTFESRLLLVLGLLVVGPGLWVIPPISTFDGPSHFYRAVEIAHGELRSRQFSANGLGARMPEGYVQFVDTLWNSYWPDHKFMRPAQWAAIAREKQSLTAPTRAEFTNTAVYSPVNYLFSAPGVAWSRLFTPSPLAAHRWACAFNLAGYLALVIVALELLPRARQGVLLFASTPLILIQALTVSTDGINFALPLLMLAWVWRLRVQSVKPARRETAAVLLLGLAVALLKPTAFICLLCVWLIPAAHFGSVKAKIGILASYFLGMFFVYYAWNRPYFGIDIAHWFDPQHPHSTAQTAWTIAHPGEFLQTLGGFLRHDLQQQWAYFYGAVGGWITPEVFRFLTGCSLAFFIALVGVEGRKATVDRFWAEGMVVQALALLAIMCLALWLTFGNPGLGQIPGLGGRYLILVYLGLWMAWAELLPSGFIRFRRGCFWAGLSLNIVGLGVILGSIGRQVLH